VNAWVSGTWARLMTRARRGEVIAITAGQASTLSGD